MTSVVSSSAGHGYFNLKDERSQLSCIWFRDDRMSSAFEARVGLRVVAHGRLDVFAGSWHTPSGRNTLALDQYYAGLAWKSTKLNRLQGFLGGDARP